MFISYAKATLFCADSVLKLQVDFMPVYCEHLRNIIKEGVNREDGYDAPLCGFHICVDAGNGGGGFFATSVLAPLGADISGESSESRARVERSGFRHSMNFFLIQKLCI